MVRKVVSLMIMTTVLIGLVIQVQGVDSLQFELGNRNDLSSVKIESEINETQVKTIPENQAADLERVNHMSKLEWMEISGIGPKTSDNILKLIEERKGLKRLEEILDAKGVGPSKYEKILKWLCRDF